MDQKLSFYLSNKNFNKKTLKRNPKKSTIDSYSKADCNFNSDPTNNINNEIITSSTFIGKETEKRGIITTKLIGKWSVTETEKFFKLLKLCGTELSLIEKCFAHKNRKQIKMKLKKEMKFNRENIEMILDEARFDVKEYEKFL